MEPNKNNAPLAEEAQALKTKIDTRKIVTICVVVLAVVILGLVWYFVNENGAKKADEAIALADTEMYNDSIQLARYIDAAALGHKSGNRAKLEAAIALYNKGQYEEAIKYLDGASIDSDVIEAGKYMLLGDCYVNIDNLDKALSCYEKAISVSDHNPQITPFALVKEANIYRAQKQYEKEYKAYQTIYEKYPEYANSINADIRKYAERARAAAGL